MKDTVKTRRNGDPAGAKRQIATKHMINEMNKTIESSSNASRLKLIANWNQFKTTQL